MEQRLGLPIKLFFACPFKDELEAIVDKFYKKFRRSDFRVKKWTARKPFDIPIEAAEKEIMEHDAFVAVILDESLWPILETLIRQILVDPAKKQYTFVFYEKSLKEHQRHTIKELTQNCYPFDKKAPQESYKQVDYVITALLESADDYSIVRAAKKTSFFDNGTGMVTYVHRLRVSERKDSRVNFLKGYYSLKPEVLHRTGSRLEPVKNLLDSAKGPFEGPSFSCRILEEPSYGVSISEIVDREIDEDFNKWFLEQDNYYQWCFHVKLSRTLRPREYLTWAYGFTIPKMFKLRGKEFSDYRAIKAVHSFDFQIDFQLSPRFKSKIHFREDPHLMHFNNDWKEKKAPRPTQPERHLHFLRFPWRGIDGIEPGDRISIRWWRS